MYELNRVELLRDLFVWADERSARQYQIVRDSVPTPDPIRLRYRQVISELLQDAVRIIQPASALDGNAGLDRVGVLTRDREAFRAQFHAALEPLHEGTFARCGLRPSELTAWQKQRWR